MAKEVDHSKSSGLNTSGERMVKIPLRINPETILENGLAGQVRYVKLGYRKYPCIIGEVPQSVAKEYLRMDWADIKAEERSHRCLIPDGNGGFIRCQEKNKCVDCEKIGDFDFDAMHPASLDALIEDGFEPEVPLAEDSDDAATEVMAILIRRLGEISPKYADIFKVMLDGDDSPLHISKKLNLGKSQTYTDVKRVRKLAQHIYSELLGE